MLRKMLSEILKGGMFGDIKRKTAYLKETAPDAELKLIKIRNIPENSVLLGMDKVKSDTLFQKGKGQNMRCDYLLISNAKAYFIELKTSSKAETRYKDDCVMKFKAVDCLTVYIDSVLDKFYNRDVLFSALEKRYIMFYKSPSINKQTTSLKPKVKRPNDKPENMLCQPVEQSGSEVDISLLG